PGHPQLLAEVPACPPALDEPVDADGFAEVDQKAVETFHFDTFPERLADHVAPVLDGEHRLLGRVADHRHHDAIEDPQAPFDHVDVSVGGRVEAPWAQCGGHPRSSSSLSFTYR